MQLLEKVNDVSFGILVEIAGRFIGKQQRRRIDQRTGDHHPTLLAARHAAGIGVEVAVAEGLRARAGRRPSCIGCFDSHCAPKKSRNGNVIHGGQVRQKARELEDKADVAATKDRAFFLRESLQTSAPSSKSLPAAAAKPGRRASARQGRLYSNRSGRRSGNKTRRPGARGSRRAQPRSLKWNHSVW